MPTKELTMAALSAAYYVHCIGRQCPTELHLSPANFAWYRERVDQDLFRGSVVICDPDEESYSFVVGGF